MLKLMVAVSAVAFAGSASAAGWRSLRVDGSSEASFVASVAQFEERLSAPRYQVFLLALKDVWEQGVKSAEAQQSEFTGNDYLRQLDGLAYEQIVRLTDPRGDTAKVRLRNAIASAHGPRRAAPCCSAFSGGSQGGERNYPATDPAGNPNAVPFYPRQ